MCREARSRYIRGMASIGCARVSTREQNPDGHTDMLSAAGCEKVFVEHASGVLAKRPALDDALDYLRSGDTLVVTKLDRLGRGSSWLLNSPQIFPARQLKRRSRSPSMASPTKST